MKRSEAREAEKFAKFVERRNNPEIMAQRARDELQRDLLTPSGRAMVWGTKDFFDAPWGFSQLEQILSNPAPSTMTMQDYYDPRLNAHILDTQQKASQSENQPEESRYKP